MTDTLTAYASRLVGANSWEFWWDSPAESPRQGPPCLANAGNILRRDC